MLSGCAGDGAPDEVVTAPPRTAPPDHVPTTPSPTGAASTTEDAEAARVLELTAEAVPLTIDAGAGTVLRGLQYGSGSHVVLLAHMGRTGDSQEDWAPLAAALADAGLTVVTYDRRGVCSPTLDTCSTAGEMPLEGWRDVVAATEFVRGQGFDTITIGGASLGAMEAMEAMGQADLQVDGFIWLAGVLTGDYTFTEEDFAALPEVPKLFVSAEYDRYGAAEDACHAADWSTDPVTLLIVPGNRHGTDLWEKGVTEGTGLAVVEAFLEFVAG